MVDYLGRNADILFDKKLWLFDMDGTIYEENRVFDGTLELLSEIKKRGGQYVFLTNNSSKSVNDYVEKVTRMGIPAGRENFFTSTQATVLYLKERYPGALVYAQGTHSFIRELSEGGIRVTEELDLNADVILVGFDTELTFEKLRRTSEMLTRLDVPYIAANQDFVCPTSFGFVPDCGSMCIGLRYATGKTPVVIGKPEPTMIDIACRRNGTEKGKAVLLGDRLYTDIASGCNAGVTTVMVLSGEATLKEAEIYEKPPTLIFESVKTVFEGLTKKVK